MNDDAVLLRRYVEEGSENAFSELVGRYVNLVYAGALRRTQGDPHHAAEVAQQVFTTLARHARRLVDHPALGAWLHTATRNAAINLMKSEQRRRQRETVAVEDPTRAAESDPEWDQLRPVLDDAIDQLPEHDRAAIVLRFLEQRDYRQVGAVLRVSEDAARMRAERALEKLRRILSRRGVTSTAAALGLLLQRQVITAAPAGLAASVSTAALAGAATGSGGLLTAFLMNKLTTSALVATATAGLTGLTWNAVAHIPSSHEIAALRAEHAQLLAATAPGADPAAAAAIASSFAQQAEAIARVMQKRQARSRSLASTAPAHEVSGGATGPQATSSSGHRNRGQATPLDASLTFAWAADAGEIEPLAKLILFEDPGRAAALEVLAGMPDSIRAQYPTPEELYAFFLAAETQLGPPPAADVLERMVPVEVEPGLVKLRAPGDNHPGFWGFRQTAEGWKVVIVPQLVPIIARSVMSKDFFAQLNEPKP